MIAQSMPSATEPATDNAFSRRNWLLAVARYVTLGGIGLLAGHLVSRLGGSDCWRLTYPCQECRLLAQCRLPRARDFKATDKETGETA
jgi:hypothetical protein